MPHSLYIASAEPRSGKSVVLLGIMELLSRHSRNVGFFRPVIRSLDVHDNAIQLVCSRYGLQFPYEAMYGTTYEDALELMSAGRYDDLLKDILNKYKALEDQTDTVLCLGTDFTGVASALEFDVNADVANNFGSLMIPVVNGRARSQEQIGNAATAIMESLADRGCDILALVVNRVSPERIDSVKSHLLTLAEDNIPAYVVPEHEPLEKPTVREIAKALNATPKAILNLTIFRVLLLILTRNGNFVMSSSINATSAVSRATSMPVAPIATPTSDMARAGASLIPSPTYITFFPVFCISLTRSSFSCGFNLW